MKLISNIRLILGIAYLLPLLPLAVLSTFTFSMMSLSTGHGFLRIALPFGLIAIFPLVCTVMIIRGKIVSNWVLTISYIALIAMLIWMGKDKPIRLETFFIGMYFFVFFALNYYLNITSKAATNHQQNSS
jgi:hypothetical protein